MIEIFYNSVNPFTNLSPTPLISRTAEMIDFGGHWGQVWTIELNGNITGLCPQYTGVLSKQRQLLSGFTQDYQNLIIKSGSTEYINFERVEIKNISFGESNYASNLLPYTIQLSCYPSGFFSGDYGVLDPISEFSFQESDDGQISINHKTSARGFNTSTGNDSLTNAKSWVQARTGWNNQITPAFISGYQSGYSCLKELRESYNRLNGTYSVEESYISDQYLAGTGLLRYTIDLNSGIEDGITQVQVQGNIQGCKNQDVSGMRARYSSFDSFSVANGTLYRLYGRNDLNSTPVSKTVSEDQKGKVIEFNFTYNDDLRPRVNIVYEISFDYDYLADTVSAEITATVSAKGPYTSTKWDEVKTLANSIDLYSVISPAFLSYVAEVAPHLSLFPLNRIPSSESRTEDEYGTTIILRASYTNGQQLPIGFRALDYTISLSPTIHKYSAGPILDGEGSYYLFDLGFFSRGSCDISISAIGDDNVSGDFIEEFLKTEALRLQNLYFTGTKKILEAQEIQKSTESFDKKREVSATWTAEQTEFSLS